MSEELEQTYRALQDELEEIRQRNGGRDSDEVTRHLGRMDDAWWAMEPKQRASVEADGPRKYTTEGVGEAVIILDIDPAAHPGDATKYFV